MSILKIDQDDLAAYYLLILDSFFFFSEARKLLLKHLPRFEGIKSYVCLRENMRDNMCIPQSENRQGETETSK